MVLGVAAQTVLFEQTVLFNTGPWFRTLRGNGNATLGIHRLEPWRQDPLPNWIS